MYCMIFKSIKTFSQIWNTKQKKNYTGALYKFYVLNPYKFE